MTSHGVHMFDAAHVITLADVIEAYVDEIIGYGHGRANLPAGPLTIA